jgi:hypothetical protein
VIGVGLLIGLLTLPLAPVRGVAWLAEQVRRQAECEHAGTEAISDRLAEVARAVDAGEISPERGAELEQQVLDELLDSEV